MLFQLCEIDFVISVGNRMIVLQVVPFLLVSDESRHSFEHEIKMVGSPLHVRLQIFDVKLGKRRDQLLASLG